MQTNKPTDVHAGYFQIQDRLALEYQPTDAPLPSPGAGPAPSPLFGLLGELHLLDHDSQHLLRQIGERDRNLAAYLKILNKRVDLIGRALPVGSWINLRLLLPTPIGLSGPAQIVDCTRADASDGYLIQVSFDRFSDAQRQLLARHILHRQAQDIRAAKDHERTST